MKGKELIELQHMCLNLAYLIQKNLDAYDDDLAETYNDIIEKLTSLNTFAENVLKKEDK